MNTLDLTGEQLASLLGTEHTTDNLLLQMRTVLSPWGTADEALWSAKAQGCDQFATGETPLIAMQRALALKHFGPTVELPAPAADNCDDLFA